MDSEYYEKISSGIKGAEDFVKKSFKFLLKVDTEGIQHQTDKRVFSRLWNGNKKDATWRISPVRKNQLPLVN